MIFGRRSLSQLVSSCESPVDDRRVKLNDGQRTIPGAYVPFGEDPNTPDSEIPI